MWLESHKADQQLGTLVFTAEEHTLKQSVSYMGKNWYNFLFPLHFK